MNHTDRKIPLTVLFFLMICLSGCTTWRMMVVKQEIRSVDLPPNGNLQVLMEDENHLISVSYLTERLRDSLKKIYGRMPYRINEDASRDALTDIRISTRIAVKSRDQSREMKELTESDPSSDYVTEKSLSTYVDFEADIRLNFKDLTRELTQNEEDISVSEKKELSIQRKKDSAIQRDFEKNQSPEEKKSALGSCFSSMCNTCTYRMVEGASNSLKESAYDKLLGTIYEPETINDLKKPFYRKLSDSIARSMAGQLPLYQHRWLPAAWISSEYQELVDILVKTRSYPEIIRVLEEKGRLLSPEQQPAHLANIALFHYCNQELLQGDEMMAAALKMSRSSGTTRMIRQMHNSILKTLSEDRQ